MIPKIDLAGSLDLLSCTLVLYGSPVLGVMARSKAEAGGRAAGGSITSHSWPSGKYV